MAAGLKPNPVRLPGGRSLDCPHYDDCLDRAATANWNDFYCEECPMYQVESYTLPAVGQSEPALPPTYMHRPALAGNKPPKAETGGVAGAVKSAAPAPALSPHRMEETMSEPPKCKYHPDRAAKLRADGISTGLCQECLEAKTEKARQTKAASGPNLSPKMAARQMAVMAPVLKGRADAVRKSLTEGIYDDLATASQGVLAVLDIMGEAGVIPGWTDK